MGWEIISSDRGAVFICNTTDIAFGPIMYNEDEAEDFAKWLGKDPRTFTNDELSDLYNKFTEIIRG